MASVLSSFFSRDPRTAFPYELPSDSFTNYKGTFLGHSLKKVNFNYNVRDHTQILNPKYVFRKVAKSHYVLNLYDRLLVLLAQEKSLKSEFGTQVYFRTIFYIIITLHIIQAESNEKATCFWTNSWNSSLKLQAQKLKTLRHPNILTYLDFLEVNFC